MLALRTMRILAARNKVPSLCSVELKPRLYLPCGLLRPNATRPTSQRSPGLTGRHALELRAKLPEKPESETEPTHPEAPVNPSPLIVNGLNLVRFGAWLRVLTMSALAACATLRKTPAGNAIS